MITAGTPSIAPESIDRRLSGEPSVVLMQWKSWQVETDGVSILFPTTGHEVGHMRVTDYWRIKEMTQAGVIDRLIEMGRQWTKTPPI
jgi:hypothetical protein